MPWPNKGRVFVDDAPNTEHVEKQKVYEEYCDHAHSLSVCYRCTKCATCAHAASVRCMLWPKGRNQCGNRREDPQLLEEYSQSQGIPLYHWMNPATISVIKTTSHFMLKSCSTFKNFRPINGQLWIDNEPASRFQPIFLIKRWGILALLTVNTDDPRIWTQKWWRRHWRRRLRREGATAEFMPEQ